jgi:hypothetical protein
MLDLHDQNVVVHADKASNNIVFVLESHCIIIEKKKSRI